MDATSLRLQAELRRLENGPHPGEKPSGVGTVRFVARCPFGAKNILLKAISVLKIVDELALSGSPTDEQWAAKLPEWFTLACASPMTREQAGRWLAWWKTLSSNEQARVESEKKWSLDSWLYWMEFNNRQWFWWDAEALDDLGQIRVAVEVESWPFPLGALQWLFKAAGAAALEPEV